MATRDDALSDAKKAEEDERYDDMVESMKWIAKGGYELSPVERNLLSAAYSNLVGPRRASWKSLRSAEEEEAAEGNADQVRVMGQQRKMMEAELSEICSDVLKLLDKHLIPSAAISEAKVFYYTMEGDYHRFLAEIKSGDARKDAADKALHSYKMASDTAVTGVHPTHPIRLRLALNFSDFYYEIIKSPDKACKLAEQAFDDSTAELDTMDDEHQKQTAELMQLLRDNLALWAPGV